MHDHIISFGNIISSSPSWGQRLFFSWVSFLKLQLSFYPNLSLSSPNSCSTSLLTQLIAITHLLSIYCVVDHLTLPILLETQHVQIWFHHPTHTLAHKNTQRKLWLSREEVKPASGTLRSLTGDTAVSTVWLLALLVQKLHFFSAPDLAGFR